MTEKKPKSIASTLTEGKEAPIGQFKKSMYACIEISHIGNTILRDFLEKENLE